MPTVTKPPPASHKRRAALAQRALGAVEELLADGTPYTELPVQRIAATAGIPRSTFYLYFPDKSQLLIRMAELAAADVFQAAETWTVADHSDGVEGVTTTIARMIAGCREHRLLLRALGEVSAYDRDVAEYWHGRIEVFIRIAQTRLEQLQADGEVSPDLDPATTAYALTWMVERAVFHHFTSHDPAGDHRLAATLGRAIWLTIYGDA
ncbi:TetR/AcrR family transcriptional regulator [Amycolatopsis anabasis]|uniref:TetR/AcrR family transcriptional regulator n=1 Tax=Amycolatopsis anabasis TaxID=1840409 RepID=UPI00131D6C9D|nr:TetR/AcrR family transcriptional regulator [Amycolatopsis anabasis]